MLASELGNCRVICVEIPGNGERHAEKTPASIHSMVSAIRRQLTAKPPYIFVGLSMGGMIALQWAKAYPQEVQAVVSINASNAAFSAFFERLRPENYWAILKTMFQNVDNREASIMKLVSNQGIQEQRLKEWISYAQQYPISKTNFLRQLWAAGRFKMLNAPGCELLFITSINDQLVNRKSQSAMAKHWQAMEILNEKDGHDIALDNPHWLCQAITAFLKDLIK